jgi:hypothetical protein
MADQRDDRRERDRRDDTRAPVHVTPPGRQHGRADAHYDREVRL